MGERNDLTTEQVVLFDAHLGLIVEERSRQLAKMPAKVRRSAYDPLSDAGRRGLMIAAWKFQPARGVPFGAYARRRVRGQMLDCLRELDWLPKRLRATSTVQHVTSQHPGQGYHEPSAECDDGPGQVDAADLVEQILSRLPPEDATLLRLRYLQQLTRAEAADVLNRDCVPSRISQLVAEALAKSRVIVSDLGLADRA